MWILWGRRKDFPFLIFKLFTFTWAVSGTVFSLSPQGTSHKCCKTRCYMSHASEGCSIRLYQFSEQPYILKLNNKLIPKPMGYFSGKFRKTQNSPYIAAQCCQPCFLAHFPSLLDLPLQSLFLLSATWEATAPLCPTGIPCQHLLSDILCIYGCSTHAKSCPTDSPIDPQPNIFLPNSLKWHLTGLAIVSLLKNLDQLLHRKR